MFVYICVYVYQRRVLEGAKTDPIQLTLRTVWGREVEKDPTVVDERSLRLVGGRSGTTATTPWSALGQRLILGSTNRSFTLFCCIQVCIHFSTRLTRQPFSVIDNNIPVPGGGSLRTDLPSTSNEEKSPILDDHADGSVDDPVDAFRCGVKDKKKKNIRSSLV